MLQIIFYVSIFFCVYSYLVYPLVLLLLRQVFQEQSAHAQESQAQPLAISLIITAYNESARIEAKLENSLQLKYPPGHLEIIVASDCSNDGTDELVLAYGSGDIKLVRAEDHLGKEHAQKCAIDIASGSILVFSDVATKIPEDALLKLVKYYESPSIGAVSSEDRFINQDGNVVGEGLYVRYEMWLRSLESSHAGLVGLSGSFFSCRKEVAENWDIQSPSDFNTALNCARLNLKAVTANDVLGYYRDLSDPAKEYQRKVRTVLRGMSGLGLHYDVMNPFKFGLFSFQIISHKLMRWLVPFFLLTTFVLNIFLLNNHLIFKILFICQLVFYATAIIAHFYSTTRGNTLVRLVYFFTQVNAAIMHSAILYLTGKRMAVWQPSQR